MSEDATLDEFVSAEDGEESDTEIENGQEVKKHPRFESLPSEWRIEEISDIAEVVGGSTPSTKNDDYWGGGIPWATPTDITGLSGNTIQETADTLTQEGLESTSTHLLPPRSVLMTSRATIGECAVNTVEMATNQGFQNLVPKEGVETWYLHYRMLETASFLESLGAGSTFDEVSKSVVQSVDIPVPPVAEQRKIATILYNVDQAIQKTEDTIERLNRIQKGTLRYLFENGMEKEAETQDSPMGQFPTHWELKPMQKVGSLINGNAFPKEYQGISAGEYPFIKVSDTNDYRRFVTGAKNYISKEIAEEIGCNIHPEGTVILPKRGAAIMTNKRRILAQDSAIDNNQIGIVGEEVQPLFLYYYLSDVDMGRFAQQGAVKSLTKSLLSKVRVPVPSPETQSKIVETLESIDERIEAEKQVKTQQERLKHGLMQDLLSGTVRTTDTNIERPDEIAQHG